MTMASDDPGRALMTEWFATVSYPDDYAGQLPATDAEDPTDDDSPPAPAGG